MKNSPAIGNRVELIFINDTWTKLVKGDKGTIFKVDESPDETLVWVNWDNGEKLALLVGIDKYKVIKK